MQPKALYSFKMTYAHDPKTDGKPNEEVIEFTVQRLLDKPSHGVVPPMNWGGKNPLEVMDEFIRVLADARGMTDDVIKRGLLKY